MSNQLSKLDQELVERLREHYFFFPREYQKSIIGSALAFLLTAGVVSFGAAKGALETSVVKRAGDEIAAIRLVAVADASEIATLKNGILSGSAVRLQEVESGGEVGLAEIQTDRHGFGLVRLPAERRGIRFRLRFN